MKKFKYILVIIILNCFILTSVSAEGEQRKSKSTVGPFSIGMGKPRIISAEIHSIHRKDNYKRDVKSDVKLLIMNQKGREIYRDQFSPEHINEKLTFGLEEIEIPKMGKAVLIRTYITPSAPGSGASYRLFHFNSKGKFVPITGLIQPYCNKVNSRCFNVVEYGEKSVPAVKSEHWTTSFNVVFHYPIIPKGHSSEIATPIKNENLPVEIDPVEAKKGRIDFPNWSSNKNTDVSLYLNKDDKNSEVITIKITLESKIEFLDATQVDNGKEYFWWLHVLIDGKEGYVKGVDDFVKLGLPFAG